MLSLTFLNTESDVIHYYEHKLILSINEMFKSRLWYVHEANHLVFLSLNYTDHYFFNTNGIFNICYVTMGDTFYFWFLLARPMGKKVHVMKTLRQHGKNNAHIRTAQSVIR